MKNEIVQFTAAQKALTDATFALDKAVFEAMRNVKNKTELKALLVSLPKGYQGSKTVKEFCEHLSLHFLIMEKGGYLAEGQ